MFTYAQLIGLADSLYAMPADDLREVREFVAAFAAGDDVYAGLRQAAAAGLHHSDDRPGAEAFAASVGRAQRVFEGPRADLWRDVSGCFVDALDAMRDDDEDPLPELLRIAGLLGLINEANGIPNGDE